MLYPTELRARPYESFERRVIRIEFEAELRKLSTQHSHFNTTF